MKRKTMITLALLSALGASGTGPLITASSRQSADWSESVLDGREEIATYRRLRAISIPRRC